MLKNEIYIGIERMIDPDDRTLIHTYKGVPKLDDKVKYNSVLTKDENGQKY